MKKKTEKGTERTLELPEGIEASIWASGITLKKNSKEVTRKVNPGIGITLEGNKIILGMKRARRFEKKEVGTAEGHIKNMIRGLSKEFEYELEVCNVHFPMTVSFDKAKKEVIIKNLLGEKAPRILGVSDKVDIEVRMPKITIKSYDLEAAGQTAANLEKVTKIRYRDRNKFQDGIFITKKPGREYL